jgi:hypothetical protein
MKNIHVLPTDKLSRLRYNLSNTLVFTKEHYRDYGKKVNQNIHITNSEEIKEGDYILVFSKVTKCFKVNHNSVFWEDKFSHIKNCKKIILTTDPDLIKDGVQPIDDEFLEWFVKNPSCEFVETFYSDKDLKGYWRGIEEYQIIIPKEEQCTCKLGEPYNNACCKVHGSIPKEEPKQCCDSGIVDDFCINTLKCKHAIEISKQETLEEAAEWLNKKFDGKGVEIKIIDWGKNERYNYPPSSLLEEYAKWQAKRMYSKEDMKQFGLYLGDNFKKLKGKTIDEIFEQFKKK